MISHHMKSSFGCDAVVLNKGPKLKGSKFLPKGNKKKFVGYQLLTKGYCLVLGGFKVRKFNKVEKSYAGGI